MNEENQPPPPINFITVIELAKELSIKTSTVYSHVFKMKIPSYKLPLATQTYFLLDEVNDCLSKSENKSNALNYNLIERNSMSKKANATKTLIDVEQLSELLKIKTSTVYNWTHKKIVPVHKYPGTKKIYFIKEEIIEKILNNRTSTKDELEIQAQTKLMKTRKIA